MLESIENTLQNFLKGHPILNWLISHPLASIIMVPVIWFLLGGLLKAIAELSEKFWIAFLGFPIKLGRLLLIKIRKIFRIPNKSGIDLAVVQVKDEETRLANIVKRLAELKKEQDHLWQEMTNILENK